MPTQNPWAWVGMDMGTQCRALLPTLSPIGETNHDSANLGPNLIIKVKIGEASIPTNSLSRTNLIDAL